MAVTKFERDKVGKWVRIDYTLNGMPQTVVTWKRNKDECIKHVHDKGGVFQKVRKYDGESHINESL